jgi:hypothetical protein
MRQIDNNINLGTIREDATTLAFAWNGKLGRGIKIS